MVAPRTSDSRWEKERMNWPSTICEGPQGKEQGAYYLDAENGCLHQWRRILLLTASDRGTHLSRGSVPDPFPAALPG